MKNFKLIFHILYVLSAILVMYFSIDILINTEAYISKVKLSTYITFPKYVMGIFLFLSVLMAVEFVLFQMHMYRTKGGQGSLEKEIVALKAKLYDKHEAEIEAEANALEPSSENIDDEGKEE